MDNDSLIHVARYFTWNEEKMQTTWFAEMEKLQYEIGVEYDKRLDKDPQISSSQPKNNGGYCMVCYSELNK